MVHQSGLSYNVVLREWDTVHKRLGYTKKELKHSDHKQATGPGNTMCIAQYYEHVASMATACGAIGKAAEKVASEACQDIKAYMQQGAPVDEHLADQLLLPLAICAGGRFRTGPLSMHTTSNLDVLSWFFGDDIWESSETDDYTEIRIKAMR